MDKEDITIKEQVKTCVEEEIGKVIEDNITIDNVKYLGMLIDIHKDIENENYWKEKLDMMYKTNNTYGRRSRDSRGRYMGRNEYNHQPLDDLMDNYNRYSYSHGTYGNKEECMQSLDYMLQSVEDFFAMLEEDADSQEEVDMIKRTARKIADR